MSLFTFSIQNHSFEVIEVEGMLVKRNKDVFKSNFTELTINSGQRYSILVNANQKIGAYGLRFYSNGCQRNQGFTQEIIGTVLYDGYDDVNKQLEAKFNQARTSCTDLPKDALIPYCDHTSYPLFCNPPPKNNSYFEMKIIIATTVKNLFGDDPYKQNVAGTLSKKTFQPYLDHLWSNLKNNTLLDIYKDISTHNSTKNFYNLNEAKVVQDIFFNSTLIILFFQYNRHLHVIMILNLHLDIDELEHPIHLHGHFFYVLGFGKSFAKISPNYDYSLNEINPIQRDTITVPSRGYIIQILFYHAFFSFAN